ncbi:glycerophosphodiester phosphodiesterase [Pelagibaculum spongiae]|uniref:Glycerophosphodiester phosphodiesterase n=1 Tax=Pelagibaculum spongiae TaxID=2080658 RepID=A0A2V1GXS6_9GAMM|nr:glycerophosphodiester phosphodiesterase [Pelagibaculum spongiae]PVZ66675.1 glycerophosphodiester phosphodiesterase [Pelagibaculum spongiae]
MRRLILIFPMTVVIWLVLWLLPAANSVAPHRYYESSNTLAVIAHRAGRGEMPDSTLPAAVAAHRLNAVIELDIHQSKDAVLVVRHNDTVDATTEGSGLIKQRTLQQLKQLDAGYRFDPQKKSSFPFRNKNIKIATLAEIIAATPNAKYVFELKQIEPSIVEPLCRFINKNSLQNKVLVGSFSIDALADFRQLCPDVATSMSAQEVLALVLMQKIGLSHLLPIRANAVQVPIYRYGLTILTPSFVEAVQQRGLRVEAWTINQPKQMQKMIDLAVDGIITDYPAKLIRLLGEK